MTPSSSDREGAAPGTQTDGPDAVVSFPQDPRCHMLVVVLLAGHALRAMNHARDTVDGGLNSTLVLLDILQAEREARARIRQAGAAPGSGPAPRGPRSILAITAAIDV